MRVALFADLPNWIIDRIAKRMAWGIDGALHCGYFCRTEGGYVDPQEILGLAADADLIHLLNWNASFAVPTLLAADKRVLISVRSHRFDAGFRQVAQQIPVHVITPQLQMEFHGSRYIPDGLMIDPKPLRVGCAFYPTSRDYKGVPLIEEACHQIGAEFYPAAGNLPSSDMIAWFRSIDVYCCASIAEGHSTPVIEALALNKPVVSTRVGMPFAADLPGITWVDRSVAGISVGLRAHCTARALAGYGWPDICIQFERLYADLCSNAKAA